MHSASRHFAWIFALFFCALSLAEPRLPKFKNDRERIKFLVYAKMLIPDIFQESAEHGGDLFAQVLHQEKIQKKFKDNARFQELWKLHGEGLAQLEVKVEGKGEVRARVIDPDEMQNWRATLEQIVKDAPSDSIAQHLSSKIKTLAERLNGRSSDHYRGALFQTLSPEHRSRLRTMSTQERDRFLAQPGVLPGSFKGTAFRGEVFGIKGEFTREQAIEMLNELPVLEAQLAKHVQTMILLQKLNPKALTSKELALGTIPQISEGTLDTFVDRDIYVPALKDAATRIGMPYEDLAKAVGGPTRMTRGNEAKGIAPKVINEGIMAKAISDLTSHKIEIVQTLAGNVTLFEIPPELAIFRGCVGGDCSTTHSGDVPNAPMERVFYVKNGKAGLKGQVSATIVEIPGGKKALYVHTIAGKRMSTADSLAVLQGLHAAKKTFGVDEIALVHDRHLSNANNYEAPRSAFRAASQGAEIVPITYLDADIREELKAGGYDGPSTNTHAYIYRPQPVEGLAVTATPSVHMLPSFHDVPIKREDILGLAVDLSMLVESNDQNIRRVLKSLERHESISQRDFNRILSTLRNGHHQGIEGYYAAVRNELRKHNFELSDEFIDKRPHWFAQGHLNSADVKDPKRFGALSDKQKLRTVEFVIATLTDADYHESELSEILEPNKEYFAKSPKMLAYLKKLASADAPQLQDLNQLSELARALKPKNLRELLSAIPSLTNHSNHNISETARQLAASIPDWTQEQLLEMAAGLHSPDLIHRAKIRKFLIQFNLTDGPTQRTMLERYVEIGLDKKGYHQNVVLLKGTELSKEASDWVFEQWKTGNRQLAKEILQRHPTHDQEALAELLLQAVEDLTKGYKYDRTLMSEFEEVLRWQPAKSMQLAYQKAAGLLRGQPSPQIELALFQLARGIRPDDDQFGLAVVEKVLEKAVGGPSLAVNFMELKNEAIHQRLAEAIAKGPADPEFQRALTILEGHHSPLQDVTRKAVVDAWVAGNPTGTTHQLLMSLLTRHNLTPEDLRRISAFLDGPKAEGAEKILRHHQLTDPLVQQRLVAYQMKNREARFDLSGVEQAPKFGLAAHLAIAKNLDSKQPDEVFHALELLRLQPSSHRPTLEKLLKLTLETQERLAAQALGAVEELPPDIVDKLIEAIRSKHAHHRPRALEVFASMRNPSLKAHDILTEVIVDPASSPDEQQRAIEALSWNGQSRMLSGDNALRIKHFPGDYGRPGNSHLIYLKSALRSSDPRFQVELINDAKTLLEEGGRDAKQAHNNFTQAEVLLNRVIELKPNHPTVLKAATELYLSHSTTRGAMILEALWGKKKEPGSRIPMPAEVSRLLADSLGASNDPARHARVIGWMAEGKISDSKALDKVAAYLKAEGIKGEVDRQVFLASGALLESQKQNHPKLVDALFSLFPKSFDRSEVLDALVPAARRDGAVRIRIAELIPSGFETDHQHILNVLQQVGMGQPEVLKQIESLRRFGSEATKDRAAEILASKFHETNNVNFAIALLPFADQQSYRDVFIAQHVYDDQFYVEVAKAIAKGPDYLDIDVFSGLLDTRGPDTAEMRQVLREMLESKNQSKRAKALQMLGHLTTRGKALRDRVFTIAERSTSPEERALAINALANQHGLEAERTRRLVDMAYLRGDDVQDLYAFNEARITPGSSTNATLIARLKSPVPEMRTYAYEWILEKGEPLTESQLLEVVAGLKDNGIPDDHLPLQALAVIHKNQHGITPAVTDAMLAIRPTLTPRMQISVANFLKAEAKAIRATAAPADLAPGGRFHDLLKKLSALCLAGLSTISQLP